jgi:hypothetical protein
MPVTADDVSRECWEAGWNEDRSPRPGHERCPEPYDPDRIISGMRGWGCQCACHPASSVNPDAMSRTPTLDRMFVIGPGTCTSQ